MALNEHRENGNNSSPAACLLITNQQCIDSINQFPRKLPTDMNEPDEIFQNSSVSTDCEPRMLDINGPEVVQNDSGIELESQIIPSDIYNDVSGITNGDADESNHEIEDNCDTVVENHKFTSEMEKIEHTLKPENEKYDSPPQRRKSCPEPPGMRLSLSLPISSADDTTEESGSSKALSIEEITKMARKMSRPTLHKDGHLKEQDYHLEHSPPHLTKQTTREFQNRYRPVSESPRYSSSSSFSDKVSSPLSPRNRGMAYAFSMDDTRIIKKKSSSVSQIPNSNSDTASNITAIESQVITNNEMTDEQRALNDITAMTRKATRPTVRDLDLQSPVKVRSKSVTQIKSPLAPALSPVRSPLSERAPGQVFHYPDHHDKTRSKSLAHVSISTNPALSPTRSPLSRSSSTSSSSDYSPMNNVPDPCFRCWKTVYPLDKVGPIRKVLFHKLCFKCFECGTSLTLKNYCQNPDDKMDKAVYCKSHQPAVESSRVTLEDRNLNITMNYPKVSSGYNSNIRVPHEERGSISNVRPLSIRSAITVPKLDIVCGDSLNDSFSSGTQQLSYRGTHRTIDTNGNEFDDPIVETRSRKTAMVNSPRHLSLADDIKLTPVWSRSALNAAHLDIPPVNKNARNFYSYGTDAWNNL